MLTELPDVAEAIAAMAALTAWIRHELGREPGPCESPGQFADVTGAVTQLADDTMWCRDALLAVARHHRPPVHWGTLEAVTSVSDATLIGRYQRWHHREVTR